MTTAATTSSDRTGTGSRLLSLLRVDPGEERMVGWMAALFAVIQSSHGLGANAADTLFFLRFGVEHLPLMILASGPVVMASILAYTAGLSRFDTRRWLVAANLGLGGWLVLEWTGILAALPGIYAVVWLGGQVVILVSFTLMWNAAGESCTTRQAKRLFPVFASAGIAGGIVGNALTGPLASWLGTENLLVVQAALLSAAALLTARLGDFFGAGRGPDRGGVMGDLREGLKVTIRSPMLRLVAWAAAASMVLFFLVTFPFSQVVTRSFESETQVASYLGFFSSAATAVTFLVSLLIVNRLFARLGVVVTLLIVPLMYMLGFGLWLMAFGLVTATLIRGLQWVGVNGLWGTAWSSLFNVVPGRRRVQVMAFVAAVPTQIGTTVAGALLLAGSQLEGRTRFVIGLVVAAATVGLVWRMRPAYSEALVRAIRQGSVGVLSGTAQGVAQKPDLDADAVQALAAALEDERPGTRATAVTLLTRSDPGRVRELLEGALKDPQPAVRAAALDGLSGLADSLDLVATMLGDPAPTVRRKAVEVLAADGGEGRVPPSMLDDPDPRVTSAAAVSLATPAAAAVIDTMLDSTDPIARREALLALARRPQLTGRDPSPFASDPDRRVRAAAVEALVGHPHARAVLRDVLDDPSPVVRKAAAAALARRPETVPALLATLEDGSVRACEAALVSLTEAGHSGPELYGWALAEVERASFLHRHRVPLESATRSPAGNYLFCLLTAREQRLERWAVMAMTRPDQATAMQVVTLCLWSDDPETRAQALEALDSMADRTVARQLIAVLEEHGSRPAMDPRAALRALSGDFDDWIRALAVRCLGEQLFDDLAGLRTVAETDGSRLVRTAVPSWVPPAMDETQTLETMDKVLALQRVPMFSEIDPEDLERIADVTSERRYDGEETVFAYGERGDEMLIIIDGRADVRRPDGEPIRSYGPGQHVGELALLRGGHERSADVVAGDDGLHGLVLQAPELLAILEERPEVAMAMLATLADRLGSS